MSDSSNSDGGGSNTVDTSPSQIKFDGNIMLGTTVPGTCVCFLVLLGYAFAALVPKARKKLDRVSFRLLTYTLVFNVLFGITFVATPAAPGPLCKFGPFASNLFFGFSTFFTTCIAINLQLVLVHGVDGKKMEKYYVLGTILLVLTLNVPALALNQLGWEKGSSVCWFKNPDPKKRLRWIIGTESFWITLAATIEVVCSGVVLVWMYRILRDMRELAGGRLDWALNTNETTEKSSSPLFCCFTLSSRSTQLTQDPRYRNVILRIALYPILSLIVNYSTVALDLEMTIQGLNSQLDYRLLVLDLIMYGLRTLAYGLLAATDPAFISAIREMRDSGNEGIWRAGVRTLTTLKFATGRGKSEEAAAAAGDLPSDLEDAESAGGEAEASDVEVKRNLGRQL